MLLLSSSKSCFSKSGFASFATASLRLTLIKFYELDFTADLAVALLSLADLARPFLLSWLSAAFVSLPLDPLSLVNLLSLTRLCSGTTLCHQRLLLEIKQEFLGKIFIIKVCDRLYAKGTEDPILCVLNIHDIAFDILNILYKHTKYFAAKISQLAWGSIEAYMRCKSGKGFLAAACNLWSSCCPA